MKLNEIDFNLFNDKELIRICIKYKLIEYNDINKYKRSDLLNIIKEWVHNKLKIYGNQKSIKSVSVKRRNSISGNLQKNTLSNKRSGPPKINIQRRMSQPITNIEKKDAIETHERINITQNAKQNISKNISSHNPNYDIIGMYPPVEKLIAIGDLHGDLRITISVLKLAEVIPQTANSNDLNNIHWCGGSSWIIQLGDQIDRCRPDDWEKNCIKDYNDVTDDEGNNMNIIKLLLRLDEEAKKYGGRILGLLGNHELMNIDKDFRYVSPKEFLEFVPINDRNITKTTDGYPQGYYHRTKAFERGGNIAKLYSTKKKSIIIVGNFLFVHGGLSIDLASKYTIPEINDIVSKWMLNKSSDIEDKIFNEIFRDDDDMSPFWCRIYGEDEDKENTEESFNELLEIINKKNKLLNPVKSIVIAHTPQFMDRKYLNSIYNNRLWRVDVGMSRAFGGHNECSDDKYRQPQILIIHNNSKFETRRKPFNSQRHPSTGIGNNVDITKEFF